MPTANEVRTGVHPCRNCGVKGEAVWSGIAKPTWGYLCCNCGGNYSFRAPHLAPNQVPAGTEIVPEGFVRYPQSSSTEKTVEVVL